MTSEVSSIYPPLAGADSIESFQTHSQRIYIYGLKAELETVRQHKAIYAPIYRATSYHYQFQYVLWLDYDPAIFQLAETCPCVYRLAGATTILYSVFSIRFFSFIFSLVSLIWSVFIVYRVVKLHYVSASTCRSFLFYSCATSISSSPDHRR